MIFQETETSELKRVLNDTLPKEIDAFLNSFDGIFISELKTTVR